jgi:lysozyme
VGTNLVDPQLAINRILPHIKKYEGFRPNPYLCPAKKLTIGWGRTHDVTPTSATTPYEEEPWLITYLEDLATQITAIHPHLTLNQLAALLSFVYNIGITQYTRSTLRKHLEEGKVMLAANELLKWNKGGGKVLTGLVKRREAEREIFLSNV